MTDNEFLDNLSMIFLSPEERCYTSLKAIIECTEEHKANYPDFAERAIEIAISEVKKTLKKYAKEKKENA